MPKNVNIVEYIIIIAKTWGTNWVNASAAQKILQLAPVLLLIELYFLFLCWFLPLAFPQVMATSYMSVISKIHILAILVTSAVWLGRRFAFMHNVVTAFFLHGLLFAYQMYLLYCVGALSFGMGYAATGVLVVLLTMLNRKLSMAGVLIGTVVVLSLVGFTIAGRLDYAPLFNPEIYAIGRLSISYALALFLMLLPHMLFGLLICMQAANQWRMREAQIRYLSTTDVMLGINNRRAITAELEAVLDRRSKQVDSQENIAVILCDLDHFKLINDTYGHTMGDKVLIEASKCLTQTLRDNDKLGRYGGEEFLISLANADFEIAKIVAERCRKAIEAVQIYSDQGERIALTASFGVYSTNDSSKSMDEIISRADDCLYKAKSLGRNRVEAEGEQ